MKNVAALYHQKTLMPMLIVVHVVKTLLLLLAKTMDDANNFPTPHYLVEVYHPAYVDDNAIPFDTPHASHAKDAG